MTAVREFSRPRRSSVSVVIITYERPDHLDRCLRQLDGQTLPPHEVIVVDASVSDESRKVAEHWHDVTYVSNPAGRGSMTNSRNAGWRVSDGEIVAFIDDDAFAAADWLQCLVSAYEDETIGGVGGRAVRSEFDVPRVTRHVGSITPNGELIGNFDTLAPGPVDVCHLIGCNMSFRRRLLQRVGGFREDYPGTEVREETDLCFRVIQEGYRLRYEPEALVVHVGGPYVRGNRFDLRYDYFAARNHAQLLVRHFGIREPMVRGFAARLLERATSESLRSLLAAFLRLGARIVGLIAGLVGGLRSDDRPISNSRSMSRNIALRDWLDVHQVDGSDHSNGRPDPLPL